MIRALILVAAVCFVTGAANAGDEIVKYQLEKWGHKHIHKVGDAQKITKTLKSLGCEVKEEKHNRHIDLKYRCPKWRQLSLESHAEAHKWEKWLKGYGFKTQHHH